MILTKGHGTENDFVIVADPYDELEIDAVQVAKLCDRRAGVGADGLLRVVRTARMPGYEDQASEAEWFMDYRNADGSIAEMCGNGVRVFALYLASRGFENPGAFNVATRGGVKPVVMSSPKTETFHPMVGTVIHPVSERLSRTWVTVDMGVPAFPAARGEITVDVLEKPLPAVDVDMGNPHAVVFVDSVEDAGDLFTHPIVSPQGVYAEGVNVEFVADVAPRHVAMRVYERGVGETRSCGTGACAAMIATARRDQAPPGTPYTVDVPGGRLEFVEREDGHLLMTGPAVLLFDITAE
jgi:diaminopimelate epimerase